MTLSVNPPRCYEDSVNLAVMRQPFAVIHVGEENIPAGQNRHIFDLATLVNQIIYQAFSAKCPLCTREIKYICKPKPEDSLGGENGETVFNLHQYIENHPEIKDQYNHDFAGPYFDVQIRESLDDWLKQHDTLFIEQIKQVYRGEPITEDHQIPLVDVDVKNSLENCCTLEECFDLSAFIGTIALIFSSIISGFKKLFTV
jgi:hypothetical protein